MSKGALNELLQASNEKFNVMVKNLPESEKPELLQFLTHRYTLVVALR